MDTDLPEGIDSKLAALATAPSWEWPKDAGKIFLKFLRDKKAKPEDRFLAAEMAGDFVVVDDEIAGELLALVSDADESEELRGNAAIALGPALESGDMAAAEDFSDPDESPVSEKMFNKINETLARLYKDAGVPKLVRRKILEASVRSPQDWHKGAVRAAYASDDEDWKLTAVFCMNYIKGFDNEIVESLNNPNRHIHRHAVEAAGNWEVNAAWPHIASLITSRVADKDLLIAAIEAAPYLHREEALEILAELADSDDEDIAEAATEAMDMAGGVVDDEFEDDEDEDEEKF